MFGEEVMMPRNKMKINRCHSEALPKNLTKLLSVNRDSSLSLRMTMYYWQGYFLPALIAIMFIVLTPINAYSEDIWQLLYQPRQRVVRTIGIYKKQIFIGTGNGVLISKDEGKTWEDFGTDKLLKDSTGLSSVNWIYIDEKNGKIYIATNFGAFVSTLNKPDWQKVFESTKSGSKNITSLSEDNDFEDIEGIDTTETESEDDYLVSGQVNSITVNDGHIYISSNDGFWICDDGSANKCKRLNEGLDPNNISGNFEVSSSFKVNDDLYLTTSTGVYIFNNESLSWKRISDGIQKLPDGIINARYLYSDDEGKLWIACGSGIYESSDNGKLWINKSDGIGKNAEGFQGAFYFFKINNVLYATTESGIYSYDTENNLWKDLTGGIRTKENTKNVYWLTEFNGKLYAATDEGVFVFNNSLQESEINKSHIESGVNEPRIASKVNEPRLLKGKIEADYGNLNELEPSVIEVQQQALRFSSLPTTSDYKRYRLQARLRNLIPRVGADLNSTGTTTNYLQSDKGISTDVSLNNDFNAGKTLRLQRDGKAFKQLSVQWNTDQFFYDDEIRFILNQARLTANIKENLLDDVTRIYFQRRRLQLESLVSPSKDPINKLSNELQVAELTGQLDSRTGGWFTKEVERRKRQVSNESL